jgi:hypothetical protein
MRPTKSLSVATQKLQLYLLDFPKPKKRKGLQLYVTKARANTFYLRVVLRRPFTYYLADFPESDSS